MTRADNTLHARVQKAIQDDLVNVLNAKINAYHPVASDCPPGYRIGDIEDANVLIQNSIWLNIPIGQLGSHKSVVSLYDRGQWASNQIEQIGLIGSKFDEMAKHLEHICV